MGYALFAQRKVMLTGQLNMVQLQQTQRSNEQYLLATQTLSLQQQLSSLQSSQALELAEMYELLSAVDSKGFSADFMKKYNANKDSYSATAQSIVNANSSTASDDLRSKIEAEISRIKNEQQAELDSINRQIYVVSVKENAIEMEVKSLDTQVSAIQKQLEAVEEAEGGAIDRATPKFKGVG